MHLGTRFRTFTKEVELEQSKVSTIKWLDWTDEAFQRARSENKPVLLDISAVWCHWCHRLDKDTYAVPDIAEYIESHFVPIRVDTDRRPDINRRYNMGGWPTTAFLTPDGRVISGGTYIPPDQMRQVLRDIKSLWESSQGKPTQGFEMPQPESIPSGLISEDIIEDVLGEIANNFDPIYGGFGSQPKFPNTDALELALLKYHYYGNHEFLKMVRQTLKTVGKSGLYDKEMGGFFRYSTTRDWTIPHFEKMSEDNAKWLRIYVHAYQATKDPFYTEIARGIINYLETWLSDRESGCFYGSQDADEEYYSHGKAERESLVPPFIDRNIYTTWNAIMISSHLEASFALGDVPIREFALKSLGRLLDSSYRQNEGMYHFNDGQPRLPNQLGDQVQTAKVLLDAYESTGNSEHLTLAEKLMDIAVRKLYDSEHGGFFDTVVDPNAPGFLSKPAKPLDENSIGAYVLTKLYHLTEKDNYRRLAEETLKRFVGIYLQFGFMASDYALAVDAFLNEPTVIRIIGSTERTRTQTLVSEAHRTYEPRKVIQILDPQRNGEAIAGLGYPIPESPTAYVCVGKVCTAPIAEPLQMASELSRLAETRVRR
jgi:uncharacterized protein YyaL (SSP411 family)